MTKNSNYIEQDGIDFTEAKNLTVGEAAQKESDFKVGITESDSVLDKYIKRHREEVISQKYDGETAELDTTSLDNFIKRQREELLNGGKKALEEVNEDKVATEGHNGKSDSEPSLEDTLIVDQPSLIDEENTINNLDISEQTTKKNEPIIDPAITPAKDQPETESEVGVSSVVEKGKASALSARNTDSISIPLETESETIAVTPIEEPIYKNKKVIFASLAAVVLGIFATGYYLNTTTNFSSTTTSSSASSSAQITSSSDTSKADYESFETLYNSFFTDSQKTNLKNSQFSKLSDLKSALDKLKDTEYYKDAKSKYDSLEKQIKAIQAVNKLFDGSIIVDGALVDGVTAKSTADFDTLPSDTLSTGNATLDSLIQEAITRGRSQVTESSSSAAAENASATASSAAEAAAALDAADPTTGAGSVAVGEIVSNDSASGTAFGTASAASATSDASRAIQSDDSSAAAAIAYSGSGITGTSSLSVSAATVYGITSYDVSTLQRDRSRVPYNETVIADINNEAWIFGEGILEKILEVSRQRGYITGDNYILERVNIINGNGYYNMFKPDGTYLFSINCKTGYFVGNAAGNADALDY